MTNTREPPIRLPVEAENMGQLALDPGIVATVKETEAAEVHSTSGNFDTCNDVAIPNTIRFEGGPN